MSERVALCIDAVTLGNPETIGLEGEKLEAQSWLDVFVTGDEARAGVASDKTIEEAWVVASEDVEPINLAATLKADRPELCVRLVSFDACGSLFSRAHTALIDEVVDGPLFVRHYAEVKSKHTTVPVHDHEVEPRTANVATANRAFLMPIVSGSGGAGKSSVSTVSAFIAQAMGYRTLLLDYDLQFGDAAVLAGRAGALAVDDALAHPDLLEREVLRCEGLAVLAAPARLESAEEVVKAMPRLLDEVASSFDVIIANTGAAWAEQHAVLLERCSAALFLIDQRASSVRACRHALELCARCGIASGPFQYAVNRCAKNAPLTSADVSSALEGASVFEIKDGGRDVEDYLGGGGAADLLEAGNEFCTSLEYVLGRLLPGASQRAGQKAGESGGGRASKRRGRHVGRKRGWGSS